MTHALWIAVGATFGGYGGGTAAKAKHRAELYRGDRLGDDNRPLPQCAVKQVSAIFETCLLTDNAERAGPKLRVLESREHLKLTA